MAKELVNYNSSVPTNFSDSLGGEVPPTPIRVVAFGMTINTRSTNVVLFGLVGFRSTFGIAGGLI